MTATFETCNITHLLIVCPRRRHRPGPSADCAAGRLSGDRLIDLLSPADDRGIILKIVAFTP